MSYVDFINAGKSIGLEDKQLRDWADEELHKFKEDERLKREHEIEMLKQKKELLELEKGKSQKTTPDAPRHRFPTFNEKTDDLDTFFQSFECQANLLKVNKSELKSYLLSCLSGKAREIFNSLPFDSDYESTKNIFLQRYNFTPNEYRRKIFNACPSSEENISTYVHRISMYFDRWISLSKTGKDFDSVRDLIIRHIVLSNCNVKLSQFLLERDINNLDSIVTESVRFFSAHNDETLSKKELYPLIHLIWHSARCRCLFLWRLFSSAVFETVMMNYALILLWIVCIHS